MTDRFGTLWKASRGAHLLTPKDYSKLLHRAFNKKQKRAEKKASGAQDEEEQENSDTVRFAVVSLSFSFLFFHSPRPPLPIRPLGGSFAKEALEIRAVPVL